MGWEVITACVMWGDVLHGPTQLWSCPVNNQARIQGVGAGAGAHPWNGVSPFKIHHTMAFGHQFIIGRPPLGEILYPPLITTSDSTENASQSIPSTKRFIRSLFTVKVQYIYAKMNIHRYFNLPGLQAQPDGPLMDLINSHSFKYEYEFDVSTNNVEVDFSKLLFQHKCKSVE